MSLTPQFGKIVPSQKQDSYLEESFSVELEQLTRGKTRHLQNSCFKF